MGGHASIILGEHHRKVLAALDEDGRSTTAEVAKNVLPRFGHNARTHSGAVRAWLRQLEGAGLVKRLPEEKPVCWVRVKQRQTA